MENIENQLAIAQKTRKKFILKIIQPSIIPELQEDLISLQAKESKKNT